MKRTEAIEWLEVMKETAIFEQYEALKMAIEALAQPEPISEAYAKAVFTWLLDYQIKAAELKGRYTPYEVLSWVANDWRKEFIEGREE